VASYSNTLHTAGTFRAWRRMASPEKWLRIHNGQEWPDYYDVPNVEDLRRFFDHYLKGEDNGWEQIPPVRYSILDLAGGDQVAVPAAEFPPNDVTSTKYYLDGGTRTLTTEAPISAVPAGYHTASIPAAVSFSPVRPGNRADRVPEFASVGRGAGRRRHGSVRPGTEARRLRDLHPGEQLRFVCPFAPAFTPTHRQRPCGRPVSPTSSSATSANLLCSAGP
jgi:hypothetical protein